MTLLNPLTPLLSPGSVVYQSLNQLRYQMTSLFNGKVRVITESQGFPSNVCIGVLSAVGLKDESKDTLGSCEALSLLQKESGSLRSDCLLSGGDCSFSFNEETMYSSSFCFPNDTGKILKGLVDSMYHNKTASELNVLKRRIQLNKHMRASKIAEENDQEVIMRLMLRRSPKDEAMPQLNDFIEKKVQGGNAIVSGNGILHHDDFVEKVKHCLRNYIKEDKAIANSKHSDFVYRPLNEYIPSEQVAIQLLFPSVGWSSSLMPVFIVIAQLFGSAQQFSVGGPGKGIFSRSYLNILNKTNYISSCACINFHLSDFGVFGFSFTAFDNERLVIKDMITQLQALLKPISNEELTRAKRILKRRILTNLSSDTSRCEETSRSMFYFHKVMHTAFIDAINAVTSKDINSAVEGLLHRKDALGLIVKAPKQKKELLQREDIIKLL